MPKMITWGPVSEKSDEYRSYGRDYSAPSNENCRVEPGVVVYVNVLLTYASSVGAIFVQLPLNASLKYWL